MKHYLYFALTLVITALCTPGLKAQPAKKQAETTLYSTIISLDKQAFDAYNKCDLDKFENYFDSDVEFFNDRTGLTDSRHAMIKAMRSVCESGGMQRQLLSATVYPLDFYGAIETGINRFYKVVNGKKQAVSTAKFIYIWKLDENEWKITKVISYDHK
jgi:hypothetical protein